jgi:hypothetical protein
MSDLLAQLYPDHLLTLRAARRRSRAGFDHLLIASGMAHYEFPR